MSRVCVDASAFVKLVLQHETYSSRMQQLFKDCRAFGVIMIAPPVFESELDSIITRRVFEGRLSRKHAEVVLLRLNALPVETVWSTTIRSRARDIALTFRQSRVYDASYAALAEIRGCDFWTADRAFYNAVRTDLPFVRYIGDYPLPTDSPPTKEPPRS